MGNSLQPTTKNNQPFYNSLGVIHSTDFPPQQAIISLRLSSISQLLPVQSRYQVINCPVQDWMMFHSWESQTTMEPAPASLWLVSWGLVRSDGKELTQSPLDGELVPQGMFEDATDTAGNVLERSCRWQAQRSSLTHHSRLRVSDFLYKVS